MPKKGGGGHKAKPKPRVAVYVGLLGSAAVAAGADQPATGGTMYNLTAKNNATIANAAFNAKQIVTGKTALKVALPGIAGALVSWGADKVGLNRVLAKARAPVRV